MLFYPLPTGNVTYIEHKIKCKILWLFHPQSTGVFTYINFLLCYPQSTGNVTYIKHKLQCLRISLFFVNLIHPVKNTSVVKAEKIDLIISSLRQ